jgi:hypothetical protein
LSRSHQVRAAPASSSKTPELLVCIKSTCTKWRDTLRAGAAHANVSKKPFPLFWFACSEDLAAAVPEGKKTVPRYLAQAEVIFSRPWHGCADSNAFHLAD